MRRGQAAKTRLTRHLFGDTMEAKTTSQKIRSPKTRLHKTRPQDTKRKTAQARLAPAYVAAMLSMATQNVINMVAVVAVTGAVLLTLLAARHF
jgi:hypothetical protein